MKADYKRQIVEELEDIPEEDLSKIYEFIHWIRLKIIKPPQKGTRADYNEGPLSKVIGCCEGRGDLSDKHDFYLYGGEKK